MPNYNALSLFTNYIFVSAVSAWIIAQLAKVVVNIIKKDKIMLRGILFDTGGMPSSHSAVVTALCTASALVYGFTSFEFAVTSILAVIVIRDATGVRFETGEQAKFLNHLIENWEGLDREERFKELLGHTPLQVFFGSLLGIAIAIIFWFIY